MQPNQITSLSLRGTNLYSLATKLHPQQEDDFEKKMEEISTFIQKYKEVFEKKDRPAFDKLRLQLFLIKGCEEQFNHRPKVLEQWESFIAQLTAIHLPQLAGGLDMTEQCLAKSVENYFEVYLDELNLLLPYCKQYVQHLTLPKVGVDAEELDDNTLEDILGCGISLKQLDLRHASHITPDALSAIGHYQPNLEVLIFPAHKQLDKNAAYIVQHCPNLRALDFSFCPISEGALTAIASSCPLLEDLNFTQCTTLTNQGLAILASACPKMTALNLTSCKNITHQGIEQLATWPIQQLSLWNCNVCDKSIEALAAKPSRLHTLNIWGNAKLSEKSVAALCRPEMAHLRSLHLHISDKISPQMVEKLQACRPHLHIMC